MRLREVPLYDPDLPSLSIEVTKLTVLRYDLLGIDLRMVGENMCPPLLLVNFLEVYLDFLLILYTYRR